MRVVVTASGRVHVRAASGYAPDGDVQRDGGGAIDGALRAELERALAAADRANNASVRSRTGGGPSKATRPKARCSSPRAKPG